MIFPLLVFIVVIVSIQVCMTCEAHRYEILQGNGNTLHYHGDSTVLL